MKILVDAMGGDNAPADIVKGSIMAAEEFGVEVILVGRGEEILRVLEKDGLKELPKGVQIANASEVIDMHDEPASATRVKKDSSMSVALRMLSEGAGDAMVSAGSTGALLSGATLQVKRIKGIRRAAMAPVLPSRKGGVLLIDCGANTECIPEYLLQFAFMGSYYMKNILSVDSPRVGLLNIGAEESKGLALQKESFWLLNEAGREGRINFIGNIEARDVVLGGADVVVCDGFSGNILLKSIEGTAIYLMGELKGIFKKNFLTKLAALMVGGGLRELKKKLDAGEYGGTALLGISKPVIKAHGNADAHTIRSAVKQAMSFAQSGIIQDVQDNIEYMSLGESTIISPEDGKNG